MIEKYHQIINQTQNWSWNAACTVGENGENETKIFKTSNQKNLNSSKRILWHQWTIPFFGYIFRVKTCTVVFSHSFVYAVLQRLSKKIIQIIPRNRLNFVFPLNTLGDIVFVLTCETSVVFSRQCLWSVLMQSDANWRVLDPNFFYHVLSSLLII